MSNMITARTILGVGIYLGLFLTSLAIWQGTLWSFAAIIFLQAGHSILEKTFK